MDNSKEKTFNLSLFLGCCVIGICIIIAGNNLPETAQVPHHLNVSVSDPMAQAPTLGEYLTQWEAAAFLNMEEYAFIAILDSGELAGTYMTAQGRYERGRIFSRQQLTEWMEEQMGVE